ncbi:hypothetical protein ACFU8X_23450 [Brevibacillus porteri]|uniref:hypothetical protein n=1 Tax=Brevibacillus porteri TaxID=2126350 RepID=UPI00370A33BF
MRSAILDRKNSIANLETMLQYEKGFVSTIQDVLEMKTAPKYMYGVEGNAPA